MENKMQISDDVFFALLKAYFEKTGFSWFLNDEELEEFCQMYLEQYKLAERQKNIPSGLIPSENQWILDDDFGDLIK